MITLQRDLWETSYRDCSLFAGRVEGGWKNTKESAEELLQEKCLQFSLGLSPCRGVEPDERLRLATSLLKNLLQEEFWITSF